MTAGTTGTTAFFATGSGTTGWALAHGTTGGLTAALFGKALLQAAFFARLEVKAVLFNVLADALALDLTAEAAQGLFEGLVLADGD